MNVPEDMSVRHTSTAHTQTRMLIIAGLRAL